LKNYSKYIFIERVLCSLYGLCETICNFDDISTHECLRGYSIIVTDENLYFYPLLGKELLQTVLISYTNNIKFIV